MDIAGLKPLFGQRVTVATAIGKDFIGTMEPIAGSSAAISLAPVDDATASYYSFAINGVSSLSVDAIAFVQRLQPPPAS